MARKPIKKRKTVHKPRFDTVNAPISEMPQRAAADKSRKNTRRTTPISAKIKRTSFLSKKELQRRRRDDPFFFELARIPKGKAYQWFRTGDANCLDLGWKLVPFSRHSFPKEYKSKNAVIFRDLMLMEHSAEYVRGRLGEETAKAKKQMVDIRKLFGMDNNFQSEGHRIPIVSESFMVSDDYERTPSDAPPIDVVVQINFRLSQRLQDAASSLSLTPEVYAQRRMELYVGGQIGGILLPVSDNALELFEGGNFNLRPRIL